MENLFECVCVCVCAAAHCALELGEKANGVWNMKEKCERKLVRRVHVCVYNMHWILFGAQLEHADVDDDKVLPA